MIRPLVIAGPTASGKSELALRIAERDGGTVINADALQVYSCWRVLSARPDPAELARAPHVLYGHVAPELRYSVGAWLRDLAPLLAELAAAGRRPIIVGGTGLYLSTLFDGLTEIPEIPPEIRAASTATLADGRLDALLADLARGDPATFARIDRANPMRVQRAWEVLIATGRGLGDWHRARAAPLLRAADCDRIVLGPEIGILNNRIETRFNVMVGNGALAEAAAYRALGLPPDLPSARALGAADLIAHLDGRLDLQDAAASAITATRQFAKRQRSWFRNRMADWRWLDPGALPPLPRI
ncbi:MAG: tRNA (adenosine(37)-N6)-dimethylallyltransferase MiaA [Amaricoccus sp.]